MLDPVIQNFLNDRKDLWLKNKITSDATDKERAELERQALDKFSLANWLPDAAKRAKQLSLVSHPAKFSHPSAKTSSIIAKSERRADGFLRTGNVTAELDVFGNAAAIDVYTFLSLQLSDDKTILMHLENKTAEIREQLTIPTASFGEIEQGLLAITEDHDSVIKTSEIVKQVYFPVDNDYHLLSVLTASNIMYKLKERINIMRFSDEAKQAREEKKNNHHHDAGFSEVYGLSMIGFGGTKPQNISVLNSQNHGIAYLLASMPPELELRFIQAPRTNFFTNTLWVKAFEDDFKKLHDLFQGDTNNIHIRKKRDFLVRNIIHQVTDQLWMLRYLDAGWSDAETYRNLPHYQKIWLDQGNEQERTKNEDWLLALKNDFSRWFINSYQSIMGEQALSLGDEQLPYFKEMLDECEEALR